MENFDYKLNKDDVAERNIIIGLLGTLAKKLYISNIRKNKEEKVEIPFYYSFSGDERYLYDKFMKPVNSEDEKEKAHKQYDKVPRGVIIYKSSTITQSNKSNPHVYAKLLKSTEQGELKTYFAKYNPIPITMTFDCKIVVSPGLDLFKISEKIKIMLYKHTLFHVDIRRVKIPAIISIPEDLDLQTPIEFSFNDKKENTIEFTFDLFSYIPDFDKNSEIFAGKRMQGGIMHGIYIGKPSTLGNDKGIGSTVTVDDSRVTINTPAPDTNQINIPKDTNFYSQNK